MRIEIHRIAPLALALALALPAAAHAQGRGHGHGNGRVKAQHEDRAEDGIVLRTADRVVVVDRDDIVRYDVNEDKGPKFCRTGAGHPVFGPQWCLQKGFGLGSRQAVIVRDDDVILRRPNRVIVIRDGGRSGDVAFWSAVVGQLIDRLD